MPFSGAMISAWHKHELEGASAATLMTWNPGGNVSLPSTASDGLNNSVPILPAFTNLQQAWQNLIPTGVHVDEYSPSFVTPPCPTVPLTIDTLDDDGWQVNGSVPLPSRGQELNKTLRLNWRRGVVNITSESSAVAESMNLSWCWMSLQAVFLAMVWYSILDCVCVLPC
jgi:hypothetical protein